MKRWRSSGKFIQNVYFRMMHKPLLRVRNERIVFSSQLSFGLESFQRAISSEHNELLQRYIKL
jgi:hypothetical protein